MMPEAQQIATPDPAPRGVAWIDVEEAALRLKVSRRRIRQRCEEEWNAAGYAVRLRDGGKHWRIREDADAGLPRVQFPDQMNIDRRSMAESHRRNLDLRKTIFDGWRDSISNARGKTVAQATADYGDYTEAAYGVRFSYETLRLWHRQWREHGEAGLIDGRWKPARRGSREDDPFLQEVKFRWLNLRQPTVSECYRQAMYVAKARGWKSRSDPAVRRYLETLPERLVILLREGKKAFTDKCEVYIERDYTGLASNQIWCGDHHRFDVMVNAGGRIVRPWLTAWEDMRSRKIVGWQIFAHDPNQDTIICSFGDGARSHGVPNVAYVDNGKDYDSRALQGETKRERQLRRQVGKFNESEVAGIVGRLGVGTLHAWPYHGQSKPIERFFGTLESQWGKQWPTYTGSCTADKPENLAKQIERGKAPSIEEFSASFKGWLDGSYHVMPHAGDGMEGKSPAEVFNLRLVERRTAPDNELDLLLQKQTRPVKVRQNGVTYNGLRYGGSEPALFPRLGEMVNLLVDPKDVSYVRVFTLDGKHVCRAPANERLPANASAEQLREAIAAKRRNRKLINDYRTVRPRLHYDVADHMWVAAADKAKAGKPDPDSTPPVIVPVRTAFSDQMPAIQAAENARQLRKAVGAESLRSDPLFSYVSPEPVKEEDLSFSFLDMLRYQEEQARGEHE